MHGKNWKETGERTNVLSPKHEVATINVIIVKIR